MQSVVTKVRTPEIVQHKSKKHGDSPVFKSPLSTALGLSSKSHLQIKETIKKSEPPTPNLELEKMKKAKQCSGKKKMNKMNILPVNRSIDSTDNLESQQEIQQIQYACQSHPYKRAKYFLQSNPGLGLCTKCALSLRQTQSLLDVQSSQFHNTELHKTIQIDKFRTMVKLIQNAVIQRQDQKQSVINSLKNQYIFAVQYLNDEFQHLFKIIDNKRLTLLQQIQLKYQTILKNIDKQSLKQLQITKAVNRYIHDIDLNYQQIVHHLNRDHFDQIMQQYHYKIQSHYLKIQEQSITKQTSQLDLKINIQPIISSINKISLIQLSKGFKDHQKQNLNSLNLKNIKSKPRTPNRKPI